MKTKKRTYRTIPMILTISQKLTIMHTIAKLSRFNAVCVDMDDSVSRLILSSLINKFIGLLHTPYGSQWITDPDKGCYHGNQEDVMSC